jgi:UDP-N-acetylmuramoyl-L-alanyl-D-glutamate--2,6-diaminopimelate ligase
MSSVRPLIERSRSLGDLAHLLTLEISSAVASISFTGLTADSQALEAGDLFVALPGNHRHGAEFIDQAIASGAVAVLTDSTGATLNAGRLPEVIASSPRSQLGEIASWFYDKPSAAMTAVGITGTNGKTTTASLLCQLWKLAERTVGYIGTTGIEIGADFIPARFTTPEAPELQQIFASMSERHLKYMAMEVSSHALEQKRMIGTHFAYAAFTNLTQDHLDFHGTMENYFLAKARLFTVEYADHALINIDDPYGARLVEIAEVPVTTLSRNNRHATWHYTSIDQNDAGYQIAIRGIDGILIESFLPLIGEHNLDNALMAIALAVATGVDPLLVARLLPELRGVRGRLEPVSLGQDFTALVDFAHTPDAVERTLATLRKSTTGKLIGVLGCGGDRDRSKRPIMGSALLAGCDVAIFTSDNPRSESADSIIAEMTAGLALTETSFIDVDRRSAIALAVTLADAGDCIVLLGKGHELGQEINGVKYPFDDAAELARAIEELATVQR